MKSALSTGSFIFHFVFYFFDFIPLIVRLLRILISLALLPRNVHITPTSSFTVSAISVRLYLSLGVGHKRRIFLSNHLSYCAHKVISSILWLAFRFLS